MKKSLILTVCALFVGMTASAQFTSSSSNSNAGTMGTAENWSRFYVSYNPFTVDVDKDFGDDLELKNGFTAGFSMAKNITTDLPVFLEFGAAVNYAWDTENESSGSYKYSATISQLAVMVPVSVVYRWDVASDIALAPYAGLRARYIAAFNNKYTEEYDGEKESGKVNLYDEDEGWDEDARRFFIGYQIGVQALFKDKFSIGLEYEGYFSQLFKDDDIDSVLKTWSISLGFLF